MSERRTYKLSHHLIVNNRLIFEVVIDPHVDKHSDHLDDEKIIEIVKKLTGQDHKVSSKTDYYEYYVTIVEHNNYFYRLVWLLEKDKFYVGVITVFRDKGASDGIS